MSKEAIKLALEALGWNDAMDEKPAEASEPVAYIEHHKAGDNLVWDNPGANSSPLYTTPQPAQRKPLTDELLRRMHHEDQFGLFCDYDEFEQIARAIEAAHGIKENT